MGAILATPALLEAIVAALKADTALAVRLASVPAAFGSGPAVYGEATVPPKATFPYVTVGAPTEIPMNSFGPDGGGAECTVQIKPFSILPANDEVLAIAGLIHGILDGADLVVPGFGGAACNFELLPDLITEQVRGILVRQLPLIYRIHLSELGHTT
jgi:Protein of unknown function (DUF3168)